MRFTIRDVLWLTVVVGLVLGWALDHWRVAAARDEAIRDATELTIFLEPEFSFSGHSRFRLEELRQKYPNFPQ